MNKTAHQKIAMRERLQHPAILLAFFFALQAGSVTVLAWLGSEATRYVREAFHLYKLPPLLRDIRSEAIYVIVAIFTIRLMGNISEGVTPPTGLRSGKILAEFVYGYSLQLGLLCVIAVATSNPLEIGEPPLRTYLWLAENFVLCLLTGLAEEIIFRGYVFQTVEEHWGSGVAIIVSSILFGLNHLFGGDTTFAGVLGDVLFAGIPLAAAYLLTRCLWLAVGLHCGWDFVYSLFVGGWGFHALIPPSSTSEMALHIHTALQLGLAIIFLCIAVSKGNWRSNKTFSLAPRDS